MSCEAVRHGCPSCACHLKTDGHDLERVDDNHWRCECGFALHPIKGEPFTVGTKKWYAGEISTFTPQPR